MGSKGQFKADTSSGAWGRRATWVGAGPAGIFWGISRVVDGHTTFFGARLRPTGTWSRGALAHSPGQGRSARKVLPGESLPPLGSSAVAWGGVPQRHVLLRQPVTAGIYFSGRFPPVGKVSMLSMTQVSPRAIAIRYGSREQSPGVSSVPRHSELGGLRLDRLPRAVPTCWCRAGSRFSPLHGELGAGTGSPSRSPSTWEHGRGPGSSR